MNSRASKLKSESKTTNKLYIPPKNGDVRWKHILMLSSSVIPKIYIPVLIFGIYTVVLKILFDKFKDHPSINHIFFPHSLVTYLGLVLSLLLVFRNNSAYDRFWEGRKNWANILNHARNLSRHIWIGIDIDENDKNKDEKLNLKKGAMRLIIALVISIRHTLRGEYGWDYEDLSELVKHVPRFNSLITVASVEALKMLPLEIAYHIEGYIFQQKGLPVPIINNSFASLNGIIDNFTSCERILTTPIPLVYGIHIKHAMTLYLLTLPLQIIRNCGWASVLIVILTSFTFFGIEAISSEIENPFGGDDNDLKLDEFSKQISDEINNMMKFFPSSTGLIDWLECEEIEEASTSNSNNNTSNNNTSGLGRSASVPSSLLRRTARFSTNIPFMRKKRNSKDNKQKIQEENGNQTNYGACDDNINIIISDKIENKENIKGNKEEPKKEEPKKEEPKKEEPKKEEPKKEEPKKEEPKKEEPKKEEPKKEEPKKEEPKKEELKKEEPKKEEPKKEEPKKEEPKKEEPKKEEPKKEEPKKEEPKKEEPKKEEPKKEEPKKEEPKKEEPKK